MACVFALFGIERAHRLVAQQVNKADDIGQRRAQFIRHMMHEIFAQFLRDHQRLVALGQRALDIGGRRHVGERDQRRSVRQRRSGAIEHAVVRPAYAALEAGALVVQARDYAAQIRPDRIVGRQRSAPGHDLIHMGRAGAILFGGLKRGFQLGGIKPPHRGERHVDELQSSIGAKHRHALAQRVQRLALHRHQRVILRLQLIAVGHVVEQIRHAALRIGR